MNQASHSYSKFTNSLSRRGSLRAQLIAWNIAILALLLGGLGLVIRGAVYAAMLASIDRDLEERLRHFHEPPPPPGPPRHNPPVNTTLNSPVTPPASDLPPFNPEEERPPSAGDNAPAPTHEPDDNGPPRPQSEDERQPPDENGPRPPRPPNSFDRRNQSQPPQNSDPYRPLPLNLQGQAWGRQDTRGLWDRDAFTRALQGKPIYSIAVAGREPLRILSQRFPPQGAIAGVIQTAYPLGEVYRARQGLDHVLLMLIPFALLCAGLAGWYLTGRVLRRVRSMTRVAEQMGAQAFSQRLPVAGNDEFAGLAETFNGLLGRLEGAFKQQEQLLEQQRRFTADASHELKTPLTIIKGHTSLTLSGADENSAAAAPYRQSLQEIDRAADSMSHLVQDLLLLARSDGGQLGRNPINLLLRELLERAISAASVHSGAKAVLTVEDEGLCISGNETELIRLFANLVENAIRYTPETGSVSVNACRENGQVLVTIADTGIGIAPEHLPHLGERFYRADTSRTRPTGGTGLGLSICKGIAQAHGGTLAFTSVVGKGTTVVVRLPG